MRMWNSLPTDNVRLNFISLACMNGPYEIFQVLIGLWKKITVENSNMKANC
jgi:hypothetical protein